MRENKQFDEILIEAKHNYERSVYAKECFVIGWVCYIHILAEPSNRFNFEKQPNLLLNSYLNGLEKFFS